jgi:hypothetical protein
MGCDKRRQAYLMLLAQVPQVFTLHGHVKAALTQILQQRQHSTDIALLIGVSKDD